MSSHCKKVLVLIPRFGGIGFPVSCIKKTDVHENFRYGKSVLLLVYIMKLLTVQLSLIVDVHTSECLSTNLFKIEMASLIEIILFICFIPEYSHP